MGIALDIEPASWPGGTSSKPIAYRVTNLPENVGISIKKDPYVENWRIVRGGLGSKLVTDNVEYLSSSEALEVLRKEFPG
jgi:hypothetical protein